MTLNPWQLSQWLYVACREQRSCEMEGLERMQDEDSAHLDAFLIAIVRFLRVQTYKTDLRETKREAQHIWVTVWTGKLSQRSRITVRSVPDVRCKSSGGRSTKILYLSISRDGYSTFIFNDILNILFWYKDVIWSRKKFYNWIKKYLYFISNLVFDHS